MTGRYRIDQPCFEALIVAGAEVECLHEGCRWLEGPLWLEESHQLLFSDVPNDRVLRWSPGGGVAAVSQGGFQNGRTRDRHGRVIVCEQGPRRLVAVEPDGARTVLATHHAGGRLNSPNDVIEAADGSLWFTDPDYGILSDYEGHRAPSEQAACHVFRLAPGATEPQAMVGTMVKPNGLAFSPDGRWLYVADSGASHVPGTPAEIRRFRLGGDAGIADEGVFATLDCGLPDGIAVDERGNVWSSAGDGVHCFAPDGGLLGKILLECATSNLCFGGPSNDQLFMTTAKRLLALRVAVGGSRTAVAVP